MAKNPKIRDDMYKKLLGAKKENESISAMISVKQ
jgi:predicted CopG family antitoxin